MIHRATVLDDWGMRAKLRPGCRALFYGPPGTGKTLTASLLGQRLGSEVFRVDLSMIVSKYIGETEKNLAGLFDRAEHKNWILFFDEADALFGKRSQVRDARDRYANQEVSFLLQRIEVFSGLAILASNLTNNVDMAFSRRFESMIHFPMPRSGERLLLFRKALPDGVALEGGLDLGGIAARYEISGGTIINVVRHVCLVAAARGEKVLRRADFEEGIRREYAKENRLQ
jgi:SpoVK/Ycf46/Vps4 family AAA+-type ATPase